MLKRWISAFMAAALCLTMLPVGVMAEDPVAGALEPAVADGATWPVDVPTVAFFSTETPTEETWLGKKDAFKGALEDEATAWLIWDTTKHTADDKADFTMLLDNNDTGKTEIVNGVWEDSFDTKLKGLGIELDPNFEQGYVKVSIEYEYSYDLRITLDGVEAWLNIDPDTSATGKDDEDDEQASTVLPTLSYHDEPVRSLDTWLKGEADDILYGNKGTPDVAYLMWDTDVVGTVSSVYVDFEDVYGNGFVLGNADMTDTQAINVLSVYNIKLTADWTNHYIQVDTDFNQAYNLYLTLVNTNGERFSCHLNIDEYDITAGDKDEESDLPVVAFYDEKEPSEDSLIKRELLNGPAGETRSAWLIWVPDEFSVDEKTDIEVYMEKNEVDGIELPSTAWSDSVDSLLSNYGISLLFVPDKSFVKVTATFAEDQTVDFALTLTDNDGEEHEVQLNIDVEDDTSDSDTVEEDSNPVLMWKYVSSNKGDYYISDNTSFDRFAHDDIHQSKRMAAYLVEDGEETRIPYRKLGVTDNLSLEELDEGDKYFFRVHYNDFGLGRIGYGEFDEDLLPEYTDWNLIDEVAFSAVDLMYALNIMVGFPDGSFIPNDDVTRAEFVAILHHILTGENDNAADYFGQSTFTDVEDDVWYTGYVNYCDEAGVLLSEDDTFRPMDTITDVEAARMLLTAIGYSADARDYTGTDWEDNVLDDADELGLLDDIPGDYDGDMSRQWVAKLFENALLRAWLVEPGTKNLVTDNTTGDYTLMGKEYFNLEEGNEVYDSVYLSIAAGVSLPFAGFFDTQVYSEEAYAGEVLSYTGSGEGQSQYYIIVPDNWTITDFDTNPDGENDGFDMSFFNWDYVTDADGANTNAILVSLGKDFEGEWYELRIRAASDYGKSADFWFGFEVIDNQPGLRYRYVDQDKNDNYFVEDEFNSEVNGYLDNNSWIAVYYVDGDTATPIPLDDLNIPDITKAELLDEENPYYFRLRMTQLGTDEITCDDYPGSSIPVTVDLPRIAFYSSTERSGETYLGHALPFTGPNTKVYLLPEDNWTITKVTYDPDNNGYDMSFFDCEIADDGTYAEVTLNDGFHDESYDLQVHMERNNGNSTSDRYVWFEVEDLRPGLKLRRLVWEGDSCRLDPTRRLEGSLSGSPNHLSHVAFYYVEGEQETLLEYDDLTFPKDIVSAECIENDPNMIDVFYNNFGSGEIIYTTEEGVTYGLPVSVVLPEVGYYSTNDRSIETYLDGMLVGMPGETAVCYLLWDTEEIEEIDEVLVTFEYGNNWDRLLDEVSLDEAEELLKEHGIELTVYENKGYIKVEAVIDVIKSLNLILRHDRSTMGSWIDINNELVAKIHEWRSDKENPVITYRGEEYTFGIGRIDEESVKFDMFGAGGGFGASSSGDGSLRETIYLGAMVNYETKNEDVAPAWLYDCISDVSFEIVDYINAHDLNDQAESNVYIDRTYTSLFNGCKMATVDLETVPGGFVEALLRVSFTVTMPGEDPVRCSVDNVVHYAYNQRIYPDMSEIDTAEELNEILSSQSTFIEWIREQDEEQGTDMYQQYMTNQSLNWEASFVLKLPAVTYDNIIEVNLAGVDYEMSGSTDDDTGKRTTMPGMWLHNNEVFFLSKIDFVAVNGITQKYDGETFTCGVLARGEEKNTRYGDAYTIHDCTFTGFDYGVRNTPYGYACVGGRNHFNNCDVGYLIDCAGKTGGNANDQTSECIFENCKTAIKILGLPEYISPYDYRIYNCDFINNNKDIESTLDGRLYCYFNYFGHYTRGAKSLADVTDLKQIQSRPAGIKEKKNATIITNPRYALPINAWDNWDSNYLTIDNGRHTYIFNSQAGDLLLDAKALTEVVESSEEEITINVMGDDEKVTGTWTFNGKED